MKRRLQLVVIFTAGATLLAGMPLSAYAQSTTCTQSYRTPQWIYTDCTDGTHTQTYVMPQAQPAQSAPLPYAPPSGPPGDARSAPSNNCAQCGAQPVPVQQPTPVRPINMTQTQPAPLQVTTLLHLNR